MTSDSVFWRDLRDEIKADAGFAAMVEMYSLLITHDSLCCPLGEDE